jgi:transposase
MAAGTPLGPVRRAAARPPGPCSRAPAGLPQAADRRPGHLRKLIQVLRFGCSYASIADCTCGAATIRGRRDEWIKAGIFGQLTTIARESYDRIVGLVLEDLAIDGCIAKAPGGGECAGRSPVDRGKLGMKRSLMVEGKGIPPGRVLAFANRHDSPLLATTLDKLDDTGPLPDDITVHLNAGYDSQKTPGELASRSITGEIAHKGDKAPIPAGQRWQVERTNAWHNSFNRLQRCYEGRHRRVLRPRRDHHHRPSPHPRGMDPLLVGRPPGQATMTTHLSARSLKAIFAIPGDRVCIPTSRDTHRDKR